MKKAHSYSFHNVYEPAGEMQMDYAGDKLWIMDPRTRVGQEAYVLVCVLPFSSLAFVTAMLSTTMENYFDGLSRCLNYFGGVPLIVKSDNMRQWVKRYDRYEPAFTEAANQWALHYSTCLENCRVSKPRDKGPAESLVNQVYRFYYARIESGNGSGQREEFHSIDELNTRLHELNDEYNTCDEVYWRLTLGQVSQQREAPDEPATTRGICLQVRETLHNNGYLHPPEEYTGARAGQCTPTGGRNVLYARKRRCQGTVSIHIRQSLVGAVCPLPAGVPRAFFIF